MQDIKQCSQCKEKKPITEYYRNSWSPDGYKAGCKLCEKAGKRVVYSKDYYKNKTLMRTYGITLKEYNQMLKDQNYCCDICGIHEKHCPKSLAVDHCHTSGNIRALLCQHCNTGLGQFRDNTEFLALAINYLERHNDV